MCGSPKEEGGNYQAAANTIFKPRVLNGDMFEIEVLEQGKLQKLFDRDKSEFTLTRDNLRQKEDEQTDILMKRFQNQQWMKYRDLCDFETRKVPVANGRRFVVLCQITPKAQILESNKAYIYGH